MKGDSQLAKKGTWNHFEWCWYFVVVVFVYKMRSHNTECAVSQSAAVRLQSNSNCGKIGAYCRTMVFGARQTHPIACNDIFFSSFLSFQITMLQAAIAIL